MKRNHENVKELVVADNWEEVEEETSSLGAEGNEREEDPFGSRNSSNSYPSFAQNELLSKQHPRPQTKTLTLTKPEINTQQTISSTLNHSNNQNAPSSTTISKCTSTLPLSPLSKSLPIHCHMRELCSSLALPSDTTCNTSEIVFHPKTKVKSGREYNKRKCVTTPNHDEMENIVSIGRMSSLHHSVEVSISSRSACESYIRIRGDQHKSAPVHGIIENQTKKKTKDIMDDLPTVNDTKRTLGLLDTMMIPLAPRNKLQVKSRFLSFPRKGVDGATIEIDKDRTVCISHSYLALEYNESGSFHVRQQKNLENITHGKTNDNDEEVVGNRDSNGEVINGSKTDSEYEFIKENNNDYHLTDQKPNFLEAFAMVCMPPIKGSGNFHNTNSKNNVPTSTQNSTPNLNSTSTKENKSSTQSSLSSKSVQNQILNSETNHDHAPIGNDGLTTNQNNVDNKSSTRQKHHPNINTMKGFILIRGNLGRLKMKSKHKRKEGVERTTHKRKNTKQKKKKESKFDIEITFPLDFTPLLVKLCNMQTSINSILRNSTQTSDHVKLRDHNLDCSILLLVAGLNDSHLHSYKVSLKLNLTSEHFEPIIEKINFPGFCSKPRTENNHNHKKRDVFSWDAFLDGIASNTLDECDVANKMHKSSKEIVNRFNTNYQEFRDIHVESDKVPPNASHITSCLILKSPITAISTISIPKDKYTKESERENNIKNDKGSEIGRKSCENFIAMACQDGTIRIITYIFKENCGELAASSDSLTSNQIDILDLSQFVVDGPISSLHFSFKKSLLRDDKSCSSQYVVDLVVGSTCGFACLFRRNGKHSFDGPIKIVTGIREGWEERGYGHNNQNDTMKNVGDAVMTINQCSPNNLRSSPIQPNSSIIAIGTHSGHLMLFLEKSKDKDEGKNTSCELDSKTNTELHAEESKSSGSKSVCPDFLSNKLFSHERIPRHPSFELFWHTQLPFSIHGISFVNNKTNPIPEMIVISKGKIHLFGLTCTDLKNISNDLANELCSYLSSL